MATLEQRAANKQAAQQIIDVRDGDGLDALDYVMAEDVVLDTGSPEQGRGRDVHKISILSFRSGLPDLFSEANEVVAEHDRVVVHYTARGIHDGDLMGIEPTGTSVEAPGFVLYRFDDETVVEASNHGDTFGLFTQLGVIEPPGQ